MTSQSIACPQCESSIQFDPLALLKGARFRCENCDAEIAISQESSNEAVKTMQRFEEAKREATGG